jgi:hypothetical protein
MPVVRNIIVPEDNIVLTDLTSTETSPTAGTETEQSFKTKLLASLASAQNGSH